MNTHKLKNHNSAPTQRICKEWLGVPTRVLLALMLLFAIQPVGSAAAADNQETQMGKALMDMQEAATDASRTPSEGWRDCDVKRVGAGWGNVYLRLVCPGVPENWFIARKDQEKEMLATGLTAITLKKKVQVHLAHTPAGYHEVQACYVLE